MIEFKKIEYSFQLMRILKNDKIIKDPVHGYVGLTKLEYQLLQLPVMNRLHNIRQMGVAHLVYPGALTTRFLHSVGVMHVASKMVRSISENTAHEILSDLFPTFGGDLSRLEQTVRLAGLLHDVGHGPFSHLSEAIMAKCIDQNERQEGSRIFNKEQFPVHEFFSIQLVRNGEIRSILDRIDPRYVPNICALISKDSFSSELSTSHDGLGIARRLISGQLDSDRVDYLLRDTYATGVKYGSIDSDRIIMNLNVKKDKTGRYHIAVHERALSAIEDMLDARFKMYKWVYRHHLVVSIGELLRKALDDLVPANIPGSLFHWKSFEKGEGDDGSILNELCKIIKSNGKLTKYYGLCDRRFLPISIYKRPTFQRDLVDHVIEKTGRNEREDHVRRRIERLISDPEMQEKLKMNIEARKAPLSNATLFGVNLPPSPYVPVTHDDTIWLCSDKESIAELTEESTYASAINRAWGRFPTAHFSYVIPGMARTEAKSYANEMEEILASTVADIS